jgi:hypothetical protein
VANLGLVLLVFAFVFAFWIASELFAGLGRALH